MSRVAGKLGRKMGRSLPKGKLQLENYLVADGLPAWNGPDDFTAGVTQWGELGNDNYGDCGFAGRVHLDMASAWTGKEDPAGNITAAVWPTYNEVVTAYFTYEGSPGGKIDPSLDQGVDLASVLQFWMTNPLANLAAVGGYAQFDVNNGALFQSCVHLFGGVYVGVNISNEAMSEYGAGEPWTSTATDWAGGHCIPILARNALHGTCVTWGTLQNFSWPWWRAAREEGFVVLTPEMMAAPGGTWNGINVTALAADLPIVTKTP